MLASRRRDLDDDILPLVSALFDPVLFTQFRRTDIEEADDRRGGEADDGDRGREKRGREAEEGDRAEGKGDQREEDVPEGSKR